MALSFTKADVLLAAPELTGKGTDPQWTQVLADVALEVNTSCLSAAVANRIGIQLAAHFATERFGGTGAGGGGAGASGPLQSVTVGPVSKTFAVSSAFTSGSVSNAALATTKYGREYLRLTRLFSPRFAVT